MCKVQCKKTLKIVIFALLFGYCAYRAIHYYGGRAEGFTIENIHSTLAFNPSWEVTVTPEERAVANTILEQPFHYLGRGFQCYAFESEDRKYVLKFFRHQRLRLHPITGYFPNVWPIRGIKQRKKAELEKRMRHLFSAMKIGFENARHDTALLYMHLNKTENQHGTVRITDKLGNAFVVELDKVEFMLQHKAMHIKPVIDKLMLEGKEAEAKMRLDQIFDLLVGCAKRGIQDTDGALIRKNNLGFLDDRAIYIDSGKLVIKEDFKNKERFARDLKRLRPLIKWLSETYPTLGTYIEEKKISVVREF